MNQWYDPSTIHDNELKTFHGEAHRLPMQPLTIHVRCGDAWITLDDQDLVARAGETVTLPTGRFPAVISALGKQPVVYEVA